MGFLLYCSDIHPVYHVTSHRGTLYSMRYMGIDYGMKRVGVAFSDENGTVAFPHDVFQNDEALLETLASLAAAREVNEVVIGHSIQNSGAENTLQAKINGFIERFTARTGIPATLEPEQYSTQEAIRIQGRNEKTDASAAAIILNSYLTRLSHTP